MKRLRRRLFLALTIPGLLLCLLMVALWLRSYFVCDSVTVWNTDGIGHIEFSSQWGEIGCCRYDLGAFDSSGRAPSPRVRVSSSFITWGRPQHDWNFIVIGWTDRRRAHWDPDGEMGVGYCLFVLPIALLLIRPTRRYFRQRRRREMGRCPFCGYDLRATPERCPECGMKIAVTAPADEAANTARRAAR